MCWETWPWTERACGCVCLRREPKKRFISEVSVICAKLSCFVTRSSRICKYLFSLLYVVLSGKALPLGVTAESGEEELGHLIGEWPDLVSFGDKSSRICIEIGDKFTKSGHPTSLAKVSNSSHNIWMTSKPFFFVTFVLRIKNSRVVYSW